jgi:hypothetical protein
VCWRLKSQGASLPSSSTATLLSNEESRHIVIKGEIPNSNAREIWVQRNIDSCGEQTVLIIFWCCGAVLCFWQGCIAKMNNVNEKSATECVYLVMQTVECD